MLLEKTAKSKSVWTNQGGSVENSGMIHVDDILSTIAPIQHELNLNLSDNLLGSAGKRLFSGDIDVAVSNTIDKEKLIYSLKNSDNVFSVRGKSPISTLVKIHSNDTSVYQNVPYTGYVQVDFMFGNPKWLKVYYHSPSETESRYKGTYRNMLMSSICANLDKKEKFIDNNFKYISRYKWSPANGLTRVIRIHEYDKNRKVYKKKHMDYAVSPEYMNENEIVNILRIGSQESLDSFETLISDIRKSYDTKLVNTIIEDFTNSLHKKNMRIPEEIR